MTKNKGNKYAIGDRLVIVDDGYQNSTGAPGVILHYFPFGTEVTVTSVNDKGKSYTVAADAPMPGVRLARAREIRSQYVSEISLAPFWKPVTEDEMQEVIRSLTGEIDAKT